MTGKRTPRTSVAVEGTRYSVHRHAPDGSVEIVEVTATSGDEAAQKAFEPGHVIRGVFAEVTD